MGGAEICDSGFCFFIVYPKSLNNTGFHLSSFGGETKHPTVFISVCDGAWSKFEVLKEILKNNYFYRMPLDDCF